VNEEQVLPGNFRSSGYRLPQREKNLWSDGNWNFAKSGKPATIFQKLYRSEAPQKDRHRPMAT
jgi:hypothetical protein